METNRKHNAGRQWSWKTISRHVYDDTRHGGTVWPAGFPSGCARALGPSRHRTIAVNADDTPASTAVGLGPVEKQNETANYYAVHCVPLTRVPVYRFHELRKPCSTASRVRSAESEKEPIGRDRLCKDNVRNKRRGRVTRVASRTMYRLNTRVSA